MFSSVWAGNLAVQPMKGLRIGFPLLGRSVYKSIADVESDRVEKPAFGSLWEIDRETYFVSCRTTLNFHPSHW